MEHKGWQIEFAGNLADGKWDIKAELEFHYEGRFYGTSVTIGDLVDTEEEAESKSLALGKQWIDRCGMIPMSMVGRTFFPFTFEIGDRVRSNLAGASEGIVEEGYFSGVINGSYKVLYRIRTEQDMYFEAEPLELDKIDTG